MFFDELGPPWPKHPCTDNLRAMTEPVLPPNPIVRQLIPLEWKPTDWQPFVPSCEPVRIGALDFFIRSGVLRINDELTSLPATFIDDAPVFWRRSPQHPAWLEFSTFKVVGSNLRELILFVPRWNNSDSALYEAPDNFDYSSLSGATLNSIGWSMSFAYRCPDNQSWNEHRSIDWQNASLFFQMSGEKGAWYAKNNLAVMAQEGYGQPQDAARAFELFSEAAQALEPIPIRHLARCFESGTGVTQNSTEAAFLHELANLLERDREMNPKSKPDYDCDC